MSDTAAEDRRRRRPSGARVPQTQSINVRQAYENRLTALEMIRMSWWIHWRDIADYTLPRRYRWLVTPDDGRRGVPINQKILNSVATQAARNAAAGIMSGTTSPSRPWFRITVADEEAMRDGDTQVWCADVTDRLMRIMAASNYYGAKGVQYLDLIVFGTAPILIYEDNDTVIRCFNPAAGEYFAAVGPNFDVDTLARKFTMTADQLVREFGYDACSEQVQTMYDRVNMGGKDSEIVVGHFIEPNPEYMDLPDTIGKMGIPKSFRYREVYWEFGTTTDKLLRAHGFLDKPFSCPRWDVIGNDAYGRSPGMDALPDVKQLQHMEFRKAQAIDKMVNPPMVGDVSMKNEPASLLPGGITFVAGGTQGAGFKPAFLTNLPVGELREDIAVVTARIKDVYFNDLFLMISQLDTVRTATEIDARREEKLVLLGPAMDRLQREGLASDIKRVFSIAARRGLLPPMPEAMQGRSLKIEYISLLSDLQRASATSAIERLWGFTGNIAAAKPEALDMLDGDRTVEIYGDMLRVPPETFTNKRQRAALRAQRAQAAQQAEAAQAAQTGAVAVDAGKVLSETQVGGGRNALELMLGGGG